MQISSRFTIALHVLACLDEFQGQIKLTSDVLAESVSVNPVVIRNILGRLKSAGIVNVARGAGGASIAKPLSEITFLDVYNAVECVEEGQLFHFHERPNEACPIGRNIHVILDGKLQRVQGAMERELASITLEEVKKDFKSRL